MHLAHIEVITGHQKSHRGNFTHIGVINGHDKITWDILQHVICKTREERLGLCD